MWVETGTDWGEEPALEDGAAAAAPLEAVVTGEEYEPVPEEGEPVEEDPVVALPYSLRPRPQHPTRSRRGGAA